MDHVQIQALVYQSANWIVNAIPNLIAALLILIGGYFVARWLSNLVRSVMIHRHHIDQTLTPVLATIVRYFVLVITFIAVLGQMGVQIASILAVLGAAGLAIGLALQGTLSNIAAGLMLLWLRPFRVGEAIETSAVSGTVQEIGLFATTLRTSNGLYRFVPNSSLWNTPIVNLTRNPTRRVEIDIPVTYSDNPARMRALFLEAANSDEHVEQDPVPEVIATDLADQGVVLSLRFWTSTSDHLRTRARVLERAKLALEEERLKAAQAET